MLTVGVTAVTQQVQVPQATSPLLPNQASVTCAFSHSVIQHYSIGNAVAGSQQALPQGTGSEEPSDN